MTTNHRAELRLRWIFGIVLGLIAGYIWGQHDGRSIPSAPTHLEQIR